METPQQNFDHASPSGSGPTPASRTSREVRTDPSEKTRHDEFLSRAFPHLDALYRFAGTLRLTDWEVQQLLQDTFLVAYEDFPQNSQELGLKTRLFEILRFLYERNYQPSVEPSEDSTPEDGASGENRSREISPDVLEELDESFLSNVSFEELNRAFSTLPESCLSCVELVDVEEFSYDEVSEILNQPSEKVMSQLHRGRNILKTELIENARSKGVLTSA